jgi:hypothetical protein
LYFGLADLIKEGYFLFVGEFLAGILGKIEWRDYFV